MYVSEDQSQYLLYPENSNLFCYLGIIIWFYLDNCFSLSVPDQIILSERIYKEVEMIQTVNSVVSMKMLILSPGSCWRVCV